MNKNFSDMFQNYKACIVRITVELSNGDLANGTGFHIGNGFIVTARHVIEGNNINEIVGIYDNSNLEIGKIYYPDDKNIDLALISTNFSLNYYMEKVNLTNSNQVKRNYIEIGGHLDDWLGDEFILTSVLLMGFPPIPFSKDANIVAVKAEINAIIDKYFGPHPHFILSTVPRGGFSGGPVISEYGFLLGVLTEALGEQGKPTEVGYASVISIEPLIDLIYEKKLDIGEQTSFISKLYE